MWKIATSRQAWIRGTATSRRVGPRLRAHAVCFASTTTTTPTTTDQPTTAGNALSSSTNKLSPERNSINKNKQPLRAQQRKRPGVNNSSNSKPPSAAVVVASFAKQLQKVLRQAESISSSMPWMAEQSSEYATDDPKRVEIHNHTLDLWGTFLQHVQQGSMAPQGKHRREASIFCETLLRLYSQSAHNDTSSLTGWEACQSILKFMKLHNLTVQEAHCHAALVVAVRHGYYQEAAELFRQQIHPDRAAYSPYRTMSIAEPVGLFALAKDAQTREAAVVENVMQAVHQLCMLSPSDQDMYVLAAGTALGYVKEGLGMLNYLQTSLEAPRLGTALVAATMQALVLSDHPEKAWNLWRQRQGGTAVEWQWSGGQDQLPPICTDLALRAAPAAADIETPQEILTLYHALVQEAGRAVSVEALVGITRVLEQHGAWEEAVQVWLQIVSRVAHKRPGLVYGDELTCPDLVVEAASSSSTINSDLVKELSHVVVPVMRACQSAQQPALSLLCLSFWQGCGETRSSLLSNQELNSWLNQLRTTVQLSSNGDDLLVAIMTSLASFDLSETACELYDSCVAGGESNNFIQSQDLRDFLPSQTSQHQATIRNRRCSTLGDETQRLILVLSSLSDKFSADDSHVIASAMASTMQSFSAWHQPLVSLYLFRFLMDTSQSVTSLDEVHDILSRRSNPIPITDSLAASLMLAYSRMDDAEMALKIFEAATDGVPSDEVGAAWSLTAISAINIMFSQDAVDDAIYLFQEVARSSNDPDLYITTARGLARHDRWKEVSDVYRLALGSHALSEDVSLFAMKAIEMIKAPERTRLLRSIANEAAALTGMAPLAWTERQYHRLRSMISFNALRRLLWWDDPQTAFLDELELVLGQWEARKSTPTTAGEDIAPTLSSARIILQNARRLDDRTIPESKTSIPHVPRNPSAWKSLVDEVVNEMDLSVWRSKAGQSLVNDVVGAYRNLGSNQDCLAFTLQCLENEISVGRDALEEAISAAVALKDEHSANTLRMIVYGSEEFA